MNKELLEKKANGFRKKLGLGSETTIRLKSILSQLNITTIFKPLGGGFSGMAIKIKQNNDESLRFILVNSNHPLGKQHFTICHELYHLFIQENFTARSCVTGKFDINDREEYNADWFASFLLLPEAGIKALIPDKELGKNKITIQTILKIEHFFGCSRAAILFRLFKLNLINQNFYNEHKANVKKSARENGYLTDLYESGNHQEFIGNYGSLARELFDEGKLSESQYLSLLHDLTSPYDALKTNINKDDEDKE
ncbi:ImmA/IrrE family metallo-endopeptidase [Polaribacter sp. L3A8]|uniref:ImmA/IrrE family metallo-endopeptidase n=1 Tax=Polaribacter sp. L3A8 TaxID=2686361 RepID=UPI00131BC2DC|nr:ImmA/IrrE family metallo-endopeptidase [Polaribacter sp. L3A8]